MATASAITIDKGVPLPAHGNKIYPFDSLEVGDSFFVPNKRRVSVAAAATNWSKNRNVRFATRVVDGGVRVWRIA